MGIYAALIGFSGAALGVVGGYILGHRRLRYERMYEQRALVIAQLSRLLWRFQATALLATNPTQPPSIRLSRMQENQEAMTEFQYYFVANTIWLDVATSDRIMTFLMDMTNELRTFHNDLNAEGNPSTQGGADAARRIFHLVPQAREDIDAEFRAILYPAPWYDRPLRWFAYLDRRFRRTDAASFGERDE
jgi:hypothetical protein